MFAVLLKSVVPKSVHALLSPSLVLARIALSEKPPPGKYSPQPLQETKRASTGGIYEHRSALVATSGPHNSMLLMLWNCFWRQTDWYNGVVWALKGQAPGAEVWLTDLGSIYPFASTLSAISAEAIEWTDTQGPLRWGDAALFSESASKQEIDPYYPHSWFLLQTG